MSAEEGAPRRRASATVIVYPGEDEMLSLALGGLRVLRGEETASTFVKNENPGY